MLQISKNRRFSFKPRTTSMLSPSPPRRIRTQYLCTARLTEASHSINRPTNRILLTSRYSITLQPPAFKYLSNRLYADCQLVLRAHPATGMPRARYVYGCRCRLTPFRFLHMSSSRTRAAAAQSLCIATDPEPRTTEPISSTSTFQWRVHALER